MQEEGELNFLGAERTSSFFDYQEALRYLRIAAMDFEIRIRLRFWANERGYHAFNDSDLLEYAAKYLLSQKRTYYVEQTSDGSSEARIDIDRRTEKRAYPAPFRTETPPAKPKVRTYRIDAPMSNEPAIEIEKQIAALIAAAQSGAPFCEQCEK